MKLWITLLALLASQTAEAKPLVIAVIDTGFSYQAGYPTPNFCKSGHADLTTIAPSFSSEIVPTDDGGHGTNIVYLIEKQLKFVSKSKYCIAVLKYWRFGINQNLAISNTINALNMARKMKAFAVNYSSFGTKADDTERYTVKKLLDEKIIMVAAAGNEGQRIVSEIEFENDMLNCAIYRINCVEMQFPQTTLAYPANYDSRVIVVGNLKKDGTRNRSSNWGNRVTAWEDGTDQVGGGITMTGTSQATAIHTGRLVREKILNGRN